MSTGSDEPTHGQRAPAARDAGHAPIRMRQWTIRRTPSRSRRTTRPSPAIRRRPAIRRLATRNPVIRRWAIRRRVCRRRAIRRRTRRIWPPVWRCLRPVRPGRPAGTNGKAIAALVTSLAGLVFCGVPSIVGLILGIIAMRETKRTGQDGHGMALAGVIVGALAVVGWLLYAVIIVFAIAVTSTSPYGY